MRASAEEPAPANPMAAAARRRPPPEVHRRSAGNGPNTLQEVKLPAHVIRGSMRVLGDPSDEDGLRLTFSYDATETVVAIAGFLHRRGTAEVADYSDDDGYSSKASFISADDDDERSSAIGPPPASSASSDVVLPAAAAGAACLQLPFDDYTLRAGAAALELEMRPQAWDPDHTEAVEITVLAVWRRPGEAGWSAEMLRQELLHGPRRICRELLPVYGLAAAGTQAEPCVVCMTDERTVIIVPCFHCCACDECAVRLRPPAGRCPMCRESVRQLLRVPDKDEGVQDKDEGMQGI